MGASRRKPFVTRPHIYSPLVTGYFLLNKADGLTVLPPPICSYLPLNLGFCQKEGIDAEEYEALTGGGGMGTGRQLSSAALPSPR